MSGNVNNILDGYGHRAVAESIRILKTLEKHGKGVEDLLKYEEDNRQERKEKVAITNENRKTARRKPSSRERRRRGIPPSMAPGQAEIIPGARCVCGGVLYSEALCSRQARKEKCIRIATCVECNTEVKIR